MNMFGSVWHVSNAYRMVSIMREALQAHQTCINSQKSVPDKPQSLTRYQAGQPCRPHEPYGLYGDGCGAVDISRRQREGALMRCPKTTLSCIS